MNENNQTLTVIKQKYFSTYTYIEQPTTYIEITTHCLVEQSDTYVALFCGKSYRFLLEIIHDAILFVRMLLTGVLDK